MDTEIERRRMAQHAQGGAEPHQDEPQAVSEHAGMPGDGAGRREQVGGSGVHATSGPMPEGDAEPQGMASWGQGERGAAGYEDSGGSELSNVRGERGVGGGTAGQSGEPTGDESTIRETRE